MTDAKPPLKAELIWSDGLRFGASAGHAAIVVDGEGDAGPSPMQLMAFGIAGCMATDVLTILQKGRHPITGLRASFSGDRAETHPRRFTRVSIDFHISGAVPEDAAARALTLSRDRYCSAWNSVRPDVELVTTLTIVP